MKLVNMLTKLLFSGALFLSVSCNSGEDKKDSKTAADSAAAAAAAAAKPPVPQEVMTVKIKVANYAKWQPGYDSHDSVRLASGLHNYIIARGVDDSNMLLVAVHMDDVNKAKAFAADPKLKEGMKKSGVIGAPQICKLPPSSAS